MKLSASTDAGATSTSNTFCGTWYLPHSHVHNDRTVLIIMAGCIAHARNGYISTSGPKSDVTIVFLDPVSGKCMHELNENVFGWWLNVAERCIVKPVCESSNCSDFSQTFGKASRAYVLAYPHASERYTLQSQKYNYQSDSDVRSIRAHTDTVPTAYTCRCCSTVVDTELLHTTTNINITNRQIRDPASFGVVTINNFGEAGSCEKSAET